MDHAWVCIDMLLMQLLHFILSHFAVSNKIGTHKLSKESMKLLMVIRSMYFRHFACFDPKEEKYTYFTYNQIQY